MMHLHRAAPARAGVALLLAALAAAGCGAEPPAASAPAPGASTPAPGSTSTTAGSGAPAAGSSSATAGSGAPAAGTGTSSATAGQSGTPTAGSGASAPADAGGKPSVPAESEVCLKPADDSGIQFDLYKPQGDSTFRAQAGWSIARPAFQLLGAVTFPAPVDRESVKISLSPEDWKAVPQSAVNLPPNLVSFTYVPEGADPMVLAWGKPGWLTLTVEGAKGTDGRPLQTKPATLRIYAYSQEMQESHPYLGQCYSSLGVSPGPNGL